MSHPEQVSTSAAICIPATKQRRYSQLMAKDIAVLSHSDISELLQLIQLEISWYQSACAQLESSITKLKGGEA